MVSARNLSSPCSDEEEIYEKIEAPKWVDFKTPEKSRADDFGWFCLRAGCKQNHDDSLDPATLRANFLRLIMEARSPNIRLGKASTLTPKAISKYPFSAPAKSAKSRIPRLRDTNKKGVPEPVVRKLVSTPNKCASSPKKARSGKTTKTTSRKKCLKKSGILMSRSLRSSKLVISLKGHVRSVTKTLAFHIPNSTRKPTKAERSTPSTATRSCLKKFVKDNEEICQFASVGHMCKSSRCAANNPNYNRPVSVPTKTHLRSQKQPIKQYPEATPMDHKNPEVSVDGNKQYQQTQPFNDAKMVGENSLEAGNENVMQMSSHGQSCGAIKMNLDRNSRDDFLEVRCDRRTAIKVESETLEQKQTIREVADKELEILREGTISRHQDVMIPKTTSVANKVIDDPEQHENTIKEEAELMKKCEDIFFAKNTDSSPHDLSSKIGELKAGLEIGNDLYDPAITMSTQNQPKENSTGTEQKFVSRKHDQIDQNKANKKINGIKSIDELAKEESYDEHQNEHRKGITAIHKTPAKKRSIRDSSNYSNSEPQERNSKRKGLPDMAPDDFNDVENGNKENLSVSANDSNIHSIKSEKRPGDKSIYKVPKKITEVDPEKTPNGMNLTRIEHKMKITNPKPFRFRTNERGILREANMEKKRLQAVENFTSMQIKQTNLIQTESEKTLQQTQQYRDVGVKQLNTESRNAVMKSRFPSVGKPKHPKLDAASPQKALNTSNEGERTAKQGKEQLWDLLTVQDQSTRVLKQPRKRWNAPAAVPDKFVSDASDDIALSQEDVIQTVEVAPERSPCIKTSSSCSRGRLPPTIPKGPISHSIGSSKNPVCKKNRQMRLL